MAKPRLPRRGVAAPPARRLMVAVAIAIVAALQITLVWDKMALPFLDGRFHYNYDNALFSSFARSGIRAGDARSQLGVTMRSYEAWGRAVGPPGYYTHHPFLFKTGFQLWVRMFGDTELSSRAYALAVALVATAGAVTALAIATGSPWPALAGAVVMVVTPLFAAFQVCIKYEIDGMAIATWLLAALFSFLRRPSRALLVAVTILAALAPLAHWTALLVAGAAALWLAAEWRFARNPDAGRAARAIVAAAALGSLALAAALAWLKGGWSPFWTDLIAAFSLHRDVTNISRHDWIARQWTFVGSNFTYVVAGAVAVAAIGRAVTWATRRAGGAGRGRTAVERSLAAFFFCTLATAAAWSLGFPEGSYVHLYMQLWLELPLAALVASTVRPAGRLGVVALSVWLALAAYLFTATRQWYGQMLALQAGSPADVAFLKSLRADSFRRFVFVPTAEGPLLDWFQGPIFEYYTDRRVTSYDGALAPGDEVLLTRGAELPSVRLKIESRLGITLANERCGPGFCAYDVRRP